MKVLDILQQVCHVTCICAFFWTGSLWRPSRFRLFYMMSIQFQWWQLCCLCGGCLRDPSNSNGVCQGSGWQSLPWILKLDITIRVNLMTHPGTDLSGQSYVKVSTNDLLILQWSSGTLALSLTTWLSAR